MSGCECLCGDWRRALFAGHSLPFDLRALQSVNRLRKELCADWPEYVQNPEAIVNTGMVIISQATRNSNVSKIA